MLNRMKIGTRLLWQAMGMAFWFTVLVLVAVHYMGDINQATKSVFADKLEPGVIVLRVQALMAENNQSVSAGLLHDPESRQAGLHDHPLSVHTDAIIRNRDEITALWKQFKARNLNEEEQKLATAYEEKRAIYVKDGLMAASAALLQGDYMAAAKINGTVVQPAYQNAKAAADALREYYAKTGRGLYETAQADFQWSTRLMIALVVLVILLIAGFAYVLGRSITRPIGHAVGVAERVAAGQLDNRIEVVGNDEAAVLMGAFQRM